MTPESAPPFLAQPAARGPGEIELASDSSLSPGEEARTAPTRRVPTTAPAEITPDLPFPGEQDAPVLTPGKTPFTVSAPPAVGLPTATATERPPDISIPPSAPSWESGEIDLSEDWESLQAQNASASLAPETPQEAASFNYEDSRIEINFYLENGFVDEAKEILEELSRKLRGDPRIEDLRALIEAHTGRSATEVNAAPELKVQPTATPVAGPASPLNGLLEEIGEAPGMGPVQEDDAEAHYNLGVAFREMNLLDEAIGEFQKVVKGAGKGQNAPNFLQACSLLALCFMQKGMATVAAKWYRRALETPGLDEEAILALQYDLGVAYEEAGDLRAAVEKFTEVYGQNIDFRDVAEKIRILRPKVS
jgi:tetratricopeptide (TPR) repeat protein